MKGRKDPNRLRRWLVLLVGAVLLFLLADGLMRLGSESRSNAPAPQEPATQTSGSG